MNEENGYEMETKMAEHRPARRDFCARAICVSFFTAEVSDQNPMRVGFVLPVERTQKSWYSDTYEGLVAATDEMGATLYVEEHVPDSVAQGMDAIDRLHEKGVKIILSSQYGYGGLFLEAMRKYPDTNFYTVMPYQYGEKMSTFFVRIYQLRYLQGMLAGMKTRTNRIGFVSYDREPDNVQEINAFALGVRRVNPAAEVLVSFQRAGTSTDAAACSVTERMIKSAGVDVVASHRENDAVAEYAIENGVYALASYDDIADSPLLLSRQSINWQRVWSWLLKENARKSNPRAFYWFDFIEAGMTFDVVSPDVTDEERALIESAKQDIENGFDPFSGNIRDNEGNVRCREGEFISDFQLRQEINWLVEGVRVYE